jgi:hypothetical protein
MDEKNILAWKSKKTEPGNSQENLLPFYFVSGEN